MSFTFPGLSRIPLTWIIGLKHWTHIYSYNVPYSSLTKRGRESGAEQGWNGNGYENGVKSGYTGIGMGSGAGSGSGQGQSRNRRCLSQRCILLTERRRCLGRRGHMRDEALYIQLFPPSLSQTIKTHRTTFTTEPSILFSISITLSYNIANVRSTYLPLPELLSILLPWFRHRPILTNNPVPEAPWRQTG